MMLNLYQRTAQQEEREELEESGETEEVEAKVVKKKQQETANVEDEHDHDDDGGEHDVVVIEGGETEKKKLNRSFEVFIDEDKDGMVTEEQKEISKNITLQNLNVPEKVKEDITEIRVTTDLKTLVMVKHKDKQHVVQYCNGKRLLRCNCGKTYSKMSDLKLHETKCQGGEKKFPCPKCEQAFWTIRPWKEHYSSQHSKVYGYNCLSCPKQFYSAAAKSLHKGKCPQKGEPSTLLEDKEMKTQLDLMMKAIAIAAGGSGEK